ncbi:hypothetical protein AVEN_57018-1 [Araneus ventricosus]|uniref:Uncharacterized protein n=1 Tax=Araneus ventricosus TaxID=182803 RepID=A0A4Y2QNV4_ARAVE|nr:hypothetical protein AVEN_57018-1 [Araneus ventricosus]
MEDEDEADNGKEKRKIKWSRRKFSFKYFFVKGEQIQGNPQVKYSLPRHSCVQEVDSVHSNIEKAMNKTDFYSPIGLIRILKQVNPRHPYRVIQMWSDDFKDFQETAKLLTYKIVPCTSVVILKFSRTLHTVNFRTSHDKLEPDNSANIKFAETCIRGSKKHIEQKKSSENCNLSVFQVTPKVQKAAKEVSDQKRKTAFPFMPIQDREYYNAILHF